MSIVKRLGGSGGAKIMHLFGLCKDFEKKGTEGQVTFPHCLINSEQIANNSCSKNKNFSPLMPINCLINRRVEETKRQRDKGTKSQRDEETKRRRDKKIKRKRGKDKNQENPLKSMAAAPLL